MMEMGGGGGGGTGIVGLDGEIYSPVIFHYLADKSNLFLRNSFIFPPV